ncbi:MAG TPA: hypothetical protein VNF71_02415 [Acidimicrobiales bacterium]|nr:hypothetical protein [Acidimicrobiales bacterium]
MAWALEHPRKHRFFGRNRAAEPAAPAGAHPRVHPLGAGGVGLWTLLLAAWAGISVFVGPLFGWHPTSLTAWDWTKQNWLLHLVPGAVGVLAGLMMLGTIGAHGVGRRSGISLASLLAMGAGAWLIIGPVAYQVFDGGNGYAQPATATDNFLHQIGANLGPGVLLLILAGMAFKAATAVPRIVYGPADAAAPVGGVGGEAAAADRPAGDGTTRTATTGTTGSGTTTMPNEGTHFAGRPETAAAAEDEPIETRTTTE